MFGIIFYLFLAIGLGFLLPGIRLHNFPSFGGRFAGGYACLLIFIYLSHILFKLPLTWVVGLAALLACIGYLRILLKIRFPISLIRVSHPGLLLPLAGFLVVGFHGGVEYLPYTVDEFTNWLGVSRIIHINEGYEAVLQSLHLPGYTPGWRLLLLLPWQVTGEMDTGASAAAPFILHVAAVALLFDVVKFLFQQKAKMAAGTAHLLSWIIILLFLSAEGMGLLWTYTLLIEQPQIYTIMAIFLFLFINERSRQYSPSLFLYAGLLLAASYLLKTAALTLLPLMALYFFWCFFTAGKLGSPKRPQTLINSLLFFAPALFMLVTWSLIQPHNNQQESPLFALSNTIFSSNESRDWLDLAERFWGFTGIYIATYKTAIGFAAILAFITAFIRRRDSVLMLFSGYFILYLTALYWYHLTVFNDYYFKNLMSVERFTRIPLQIFHSLGLLLLTELAIHYWPRMKLGSLDQILAKKSIFLGSIISIILLASWQMRQLDHTVTDITTRKHQSYDFRVGEMKKAGIWLKQKRGNLLPEQPKLLIIAQGQTNDVLGYAQFYALEKNKKHDFKAYRSKLITTWPLTSEEYYQNPNWQKKAISLIGEADVIWPTGIDQQITDLLRELKTSPDCLNKLTEKILIKERSGGGIRYSCLAKPVFAKNKP